MKQMDSTSLKSLVEERKSNEGVMVVCKKPECKEEDIVSLG